MSLESHLSELVRRHQAMDSAIASEEACPAADGVKLHELKRKKLQLKDEIEKVKHVTPRATKH